MSNHDERGKGLTYRLVLLLNQGITIIVLDSKTKSRWVDVAVAPDEKGAEDGLSKEVKHAIEDSLAIRSDDVTTKEWG
jgi:hypothetical protein